jgi:hypothetical protein
MRDGSELEIAPMEPKEGCSTCCCIESDRGLMLPVGDMWPGRWEEKRLAVKGSCGLYWAAGKDCMPMPIMCLIWCEPCDDIATAC